MYVGIIGTSGEGCIFIIMGQRGGGVGADILGAREGVGGGGAMMGRGSKYGTDTVRLY